MLTNDETKKLWELVEPLKNCMLVTQSTQSAPSLQARPMHLVQSEFDGHFYFFTNKHSLKVDEFQQHPEVCLAFSCPKSETYVSISGHATLNTNKTLIDKFWNPFIAAWFPKGKEDPNVVLIEIACYQAEYWNVTENKLVQLFKYAAANLTGSTPTMGEHEKM